MRFSQTVSRTRRASKFRFRFAAIVIVANAVNVLTCFSQIQAKEDPPSRVAVLKPGPNVQYELQSRLIDAVPGDVIRLPAGHYRFHRQLDITTQHLTIRGDGSDKTILSFAEQETGGAGIEATGDHLKLEGFAVENTTGNAIKVLGANGVIFRDIRAEWTGPAAATNGAYGLYPVQCRNVLIEKCSVMGASDAGIYVGQSQNVIVRDNRAERNVAGIEVENTIGADVYNNVAMNNTGGILVFDLPGLQVHAGRRIRVFDNQVKNNNHLNFAAKGNVVASVPPGTGIMVMATDEVEVFGNEVFNQQTAGVAILAYQATGKRKKNQKELDFDPFPELISIHDNQISRSGYAPAGEIGMLLSPLVGGVFPDIFWDGVGDTKRVQNNTFHESQMPAIHDNGEARFINFDLGHLNPFDIFSGRHQIGRRLEPYDIERSPLKAVVLDAVGAITSNPSTAVLVYRSAPLKLSDHGLFKGALADQIPAEDVQAYQLNTPLFSDYTTKYRFFKIPPGTKINYGDQGTLEFPVGTLIAKTFAYPVDMTDSTKGERLLETRIEFRREDGWFGFSYLWNEDQTDATLALGGSELEVSWIHSDGSKRSNLYQVPNANQCLNCHQQGEHFVPLGSIAANLSGDPDQLDDLIDRGLLADAPQWSEIEPWPNFDHASKHTIADRARAWLHVNCAHCHNPIGTARTSGLDLRRSQHDPAKFGVNKVPVAAGHGSGGRSFDIVAGKPDESILMHRIESQDPSVAMPNVGRRLVPVEAAALVRQWIEQLE